MKDLSCGAEEAGRYVSNLYGFRAGGNETACEEHFNPAQREPCCFRIPDRSIYSVCFRFYLPWPAGLSGTGTKNRPLGGGNLKRSGYFIGQCTRSNGKTIRKGDRMSEQPLCHDACYALWTERFDVSLGGRRANKPIFFGHVSRRGVRSLRSFLLQSNKKYFSFILYCRIGKM